MKKEKSDCGGNKTAFTEELAGVIPQPEENREIPDGIQVVPAQNESYQNFIIRYSRNVDGAVNYESDRSFQIINELFGVIYIPASQVPESVINSYSYSSVPSVIHIWIRAA